MRYKGGLAVGLLNFGDRVGKISAGMFTFVGECLNPSVSARKPSLALELPLSLDRLPADTVLLLAQP